MSAFGVYEKGLRMTTIKCRFCGTTTDIPESGRALQRLRKGPATPCPGNPMKLAPSHLESTCLKDWGWDEHYEVLDDT